MFSCERGSGTGEAPFVGFSPGQANIALREVMGLLGYAKAQHYCTHDLRRGHAEDQLEAGCGIEQILADGEWRRACSVAGPVAFAFHCDFKVGEMHD